MVFKHRTSLIAGLVVILILLNGILEVIPVQAASVVYRAAPNGVTISPCGADWSNPCDLQYALNTLSLSGDELWVKAGTYKPTTGTDRTISFTLKNGVAIYGGFAGTETVRDQRNPGSNVTILSGDIDNDDDSNNADGNFINETYTDIVGSNSYHVVTGASGATLDGFTITAGNDYGGNLDGGGMYNINSNPTVANVTFSGNMADRYGGGMYNYYSSPTLINVTFSGNKAGVYGGGMGNYYSSPTVTNGTFSGNMANHGGGMYNTNSSPTVMNVTFSGNNSAYYGGGMENYNSSPTVTNGTFSGNVAANYGGGMYNEGYSSPTVTNVIFIGNSASSGGGIYNYQSGSNLTVTNVTFSNNSAVYNGGGMYNEGSPMVTNVTFSGNMAQQGGGMYNYWSGSSTTVTNVTFSGNSATNSGGGMYNYQSSLMITNVTFSGNSAANSGGGMYSYQSYNNDYGRPTLKNVIVANSVGGDCALASASTLNVASANNLIEDNTYACGLTNGMNGNIIGSDPNLGLLADNGGTTQTHALLTDSPAIDAGNDNACPATDQRGVARPQGSRCDIGAYEYDGPIMPTPTPITPTNVPTFTPTETPIPPTFTSSPIPALTPVSAGDTALVSVSSSGVQANNSSSFSAVSAEGRYVAFESNATNLVTGDTNRESDIFVRDLQTGVTKRVSIRSDGTQPYDFPYSYDPSISSDGRYIAFYSNSMNLVDGDTNGAEDVFVHDLQTGVTKRVSVNSSGGQANNHSIDPFISANGRYIVFDSYATNLVSGDVNGTNDVFIHDLQTGVTTRASLNSNGEQANNVSFDPFLSEDGRYLTFYSSASNLVSDDTNGIYDIFVRDLQTGLTKRASVDANGVEANGLSYDPSISADGRYVTFFSKATNLVAGDTNGIDDVFIHDLQTGITTRASVDSNGVQANGQSVSPLISADGRYVVFYSIASNLVSGDTNGASDIFVYDIQTGVTTRASVDSNGAQANYSSYYPSISSDGRYISFSSYAWNLVPGDHNSYFDIFVHRQEILPAPSTSTPTATALPTHTPTPSSTPILNCDAVNHGPLTWSGNTMSLGITNPTGIPLAVQDVFVVWNHDNGHMIGADKTLRLQDASLSGTSFWSGNDDGPTLTISPLDLFIPPGDSTIVFTFHQSYEAWDGSEQLLITLATNGCQSYPIHANYEPPTATPTPTNTFTPTVTPPYSYHPLYLSLTSSQTIGGVASSDEDILRFDGQNWSLLFDGSDVGVGSPDLFAFSFLDADTILMSFNANVTVNGITATPQDVLRFDATSLGGTTAGTWSLYFDGSDVGLDTTSENIDALSLFPSGRLLISTTGSASVPGLTTGRDEDMLAFDPTSLGDVTGGTWSMYFDGSDVGLAETSGEDVDAFDFTFEGNNYLSTSGDFAVDGVSGADEDVFVCRSTSLGDITACSYSPRLYFDGSTWGLAANDVDAFHFLASGPIPTAMPTNIPSGTPTPTFTRTPTATLTAGPLPTYTPTFTATATSASGRTLTFNAVADARVVQTSSTTNYGTATTLQVDGGTDAAQTSYIRFNVSGLNSFVLGAKLRVFCTTNGTANGPAVHLANSNWTESGTGGINWNNQPALESAAFDNKGSIAASSWVEYDVTALVTGDGTYTFALVADSSDGIVFSSREGTTPPQLVLTLGNGPSTSTPSPTGVSPMTNTPTATPSPTAVVATPTASQTATQIIHSSPTPTATQTTVASTFSFTPLADAYVDANNPANNYGALSTLRVDGSPVIRSYLRFDVQGLNGAVTRATLRVYANSASNAGCTVYGMSDNTWTESTINYNNAPPLGSALGSSGAFGAGVWIGIDVTDYVTGNGTYNLALTTPGTTAVSLASRESGANAPQLIVEIAP